MSVTSLEYKVSPVTAHEDRHTIHAYFTGSPESPDGSRVLYYSSPTREGHEGDLRVLERGTGEERVIAEGIVTEDAHRVACQQWASGGRHVVYHALEGDRWEVRVYDVVTGKTRVAARDRQLGWGHGGAGVIPLVGLHWDADSPRDLEYLDLGTGEIRTVLRAKEVRGRYPEWVFGLFGDRPISIYAAMMSPDARRVFFKVAAAGTGDWRSAGASTRGGLLGYDVEAREFLFHLEHWGHPCWMPDSRHILNVRGVVIDSDDGSSRTLPNWPAICASHPSPSADARWFVSDSGWHHADDPHVWEIVVGDMEDGSSEVVFQFNDGGGAKSWRPPHAHPAFSADGQRIYFNVSDGPYTQLHVLERIGIWD